jgi:sugar phosphate isomerase/epimerase
MMRFGCCVSTREQIDAIARAGFDFCELPAKAVQPFDDESAALPALRELGAAPLRAESFNVLIPPQLPLLGPKADFGALRAYLRRAFDRMVLLGAGVVVLGSGGARRIPDDLPRETAMDQLADAVALVAEEADQAGLELALEHLNRKECNVFNTLRECHDFVERYALPSVRLLADLFHLEVEREPLENVAAAGPLLTHVHVAGGDRRAPHVPGYDYAGFMAALRQGGYTGRISAECAWENLAAQAPEALAFMRAQWNA